MNNITWTNGKIALTKDCIFGVSVKTETGWLPLSALDADDLGTVVKLIDYNPSCPWTDSIIREWREAEANELSQV
jgi:hypothetical protein